MAWPWDRLGSWCRVECFPADGFRRQLCRILSGFSKAKVVDWESSVSESCLKLDLLLLPNYNYHCYCSMTIIAITIFFLLLYLQAGFMHPHPLNKNWTCMQRLTEGQIRTRGLGLFPISY